MKRGTESRVFLGKDTSVDEFTGINVLSTVLLGKKEGGFKDHNGLFIASNVTLGKGIARVITVVVYGTSPLSLPNAIEADVVSLKAFGGTEQETETIIQTATAQGKTEQRNLPDGYTQYDGLIGDGSAYIDLGCTLDENDEIEVEFTTNATEVNSINIFGYRNSASSQAITAMIASANTNLFISDFNNSDYNPYRLASNSPLSVSTRYKLILNKTGRYLYQGSTLVASNTTACPDTITTGNAYLFNIGGAPAYTNKFSGTIHRCLIKGKRDVVPCGNGTTYGVYDKLNGVFYPNVNTEGTFTAGNVVVPTPDTPMNIVSNNGVLKARHQSGLPLGYTLLDYVETDGNSYIDTNLLLSNTSEFEITFQSADATLNTPVMGAISGGTSFTSTNNFCVTYTVASGLNAYSVYCNGAAGDANESWNAGDAQDKLKHTVKYNGLNIAPTLDGVDMEQLVPTTLTTNTPTVTTWLFGRNNTGSGTKTQTGVRIYDFNVVGTAHFVPCKNASNVVGMYDLVNGVFYQNAGTGDFTAGDPVSDPVEIYTDGTVETITDNIGNVANCERLLQAGTYTDTQEILSGAVTRNVGVKVLDGTETGWTKLSGVNYVSLPKTAISNIVSGTDATCLSNSFVQVPHGSISLSEECFSVGASYMNFKKSGDPTAAQFKQWLANQYAAGTPVIIIYPLATATTESVTGQNLRKEPLTVTGSLQNLLVNTTTGDAVPTPDYPLDIICNNGVLKANKNLYGTEYKGYELSQVDGITLRANSGVNVSGMVDCRTIKSFKITTASLQGSFRIFKYRADNTYIDANSTASIGGIITLEDNVGFFRIQYNFTNSGTGTQNILIYNSAYDLNDIYTDGTVETINVHGKNLFDPTKVLFGYYRDRTTGDKAQNSSNFMSSDDGYIPCLPNTTYTFVGTNKTNGTYSKYNTIYFFDSAKNYLGASPYELSQPTTGTTPSNCRYLQVRSNPLDNSTPIQDAFAQFNWQLEQDSTATAYQPYFNGGTAVAEMLLKISSDYQDQQEIIDGTVTRKVGIKVLDGTENWAVNTMISHHFTGKLPNQFDSSVAYKPTYCTHFLSDSGVDDNTCKLQYRLFSIRYDAANENINTFKQWLADQYAAGTPVIVIYPLATATTESVTGQPMATTQGDNIAEITQASIDGLTLEVTYLAGATVTIQEVENAQLSDDVDVTIH